MANKRTHRFRVMHPIRLLSLLSVCAFSGVQAQTQTPTVTVTASPNQATLGQPVTLTATVTQNAAPVTSGALTFTFGISQVGAAQLNGTINIHAANHSDQAGLPNNFGRSMRAGTPILGYILASVPLDLRAIVGTTAVARWGDPLRVPDAARALYLPPKQHYAIVEQLSDQPLSIWRLGRSTFAAERDLLMPVPGAMSHRHLVVFSPSAESAALYSKALGRLQTIVDLPAKPAISGHFSLASIGDPTRIAVTDDGSLIVTEDVTGQVQFATGKDWRSLPGECAPLAWSFLPKIHDPVVSDATEKTIALLPNVNEAPTAVHILAQGMQVGHLTVTKDGDVITTADSRTGNVWTIELKTGTVTRILSSAKVDSLLSLPDGRALLLSSSPALSLLKLTASSEFAAVSLDSGITSESPAAQSSPPDMDCLCS